MSGDASRRAAPGRAALSRAHLLGDDVDTDRIIAGKYTKTLDLSQLAEHLLEDYDPDLKERLAAGDVLVAGENFGCGSSREQAALAIKVAGVSHVLARSFARIFYRNAINIGLSVIEVPVHDIADGDEVSVDPTQGVVVNATTGARYRATRMPAVMAEILAAGGLVSYLRAGGDYTVKG